MAVEEAHPTESRRPLFPPPATPFVITRRILLREFLLALVPAVAFVGVLAILFAAVGQLGKIDTQTLVVVLVASAVVATIAAWRGRRA